MRFWGDSSSTTSICGSVSDGCYFTETSWLKVNRFCFTITGSIFKQILGTGAGKIVLNWFHLFKFLNKVNPVQSSYLMCFFSLHPQATSVWCLPLLKWSCGTLDYPPAWAWPLHFPCCRTLWRFWPSTSTAFMCMEPGKAQHDDVCIIDLHYRNNISGECIGCPVLKVEKQKPLRNQLGFGLRSLKAY